jgi:hypothetical protein
MEDEVGFANQTFEQNRVGRVGDVSAKVRAALERRDIRSSAGRKVVDDRNGVAAIQEIFGQMRADETRAAGD